MHIVSVSSGEMLQGHSSSELVALAQTVLGLEASTTPTIVPSTEPTSSVKLFGDTPEALVWSLIALFFVILGLCVVLVIVIWYARNKAIKR